MGERDVDRIVEAVDAHRVRDQLVEQTGDAGASGTYMWRDRLTDGSDPVAPGAGTGGQHRTRRVGFTQRGERALGGLRSVDDDGGERLAERSLDGLLPTGVDLDQIEQ